MPDLFANWRQIRYIISAYYRPYLRYVRYRRCVRADARASAVASILTSAHTFVWAVRSEKLRVQALAIPPHFRP